jgi:hypothetical protein
MTITFNPAIYPRTKSDDNIIPYWIRKEPRAWPKFVEVLTNNDLDAVSPLINPLRANPRSPFGAAASQFERARIAIPLAEAALQYWWHTHEAILTYLIRLGLWKGRDYALVYNTTWARMGYIHHQCEYAKHLSYQIQFDNTYKQSALLLKYLTHEESL